MNDFKQDEVFLNNLPPYIKYSIENCGNNSFYTSLESIRMPLENGDISVKTQIFDAVAVINVDNTIVIIDTDKKLFAMSKDKISNINIDFKKDYTAKDTMALLRLKAQKVQ